MKTTGLLAIVLAFALGPLGAAAAEVKYRCADGTRITALFQNVPGGPNSVSLRFGRAKTGMSLPEEGAGFYESGTTSFAVKGRTATLSRAGAVTSCSIR